ncbi:MAG: hypothetical protein LUO84_03070, partial [Methanomassiliicoccales archaeon]|nr:hypothetical protein [Methanomassiliicoccales archaeon]
ARHEFTSIYPEFAATANKEVSIQVPAKFHTISEAERHHQERVSKLLSGLEAGTEFKRSN